MFHGSKKKLNLKEVGETRIPNFEKPTPPITYPPRRNKRLIFSLIMENQWLIREP